MTAGRQKIPDSRSRLAWYLSLTNSESLVVEADVEIRFLDGSRLLVFQDQEFNVEIPAGGRKTVRGSKLIDRGPGGAVRHVEAVVEYNGRQLQVDGYLSALGRAPVQSNSRDTARALDWPALSSSTGPYVRILGDRITVSGRVRNSCGARIDDAVLTLEFYRQGRLIHSELV